MSIRKFLAVSGCVLLSVPGFALADWVEIGKTADGSVIQGETARFSRQGEAVSAVARLLLQTPRSMPFSTVKYDSTEITYHFQCVERKLIVAETAMLDGQKSVYSAKSSDSNPLVAKTQAQPVPADGMDAMVFAWACARKGAQ